MSTANFKPITGLPVTIKKIESAYDNESYQATIKILPLWPKDTKSFTFHQEKFKRKARIRSYKQPMSSLLAKLAPETTIIVEGDLSNISFRGEKETVVWVDAFIVDPREGKVDPSAAELYVENIKEFEISDTEVISSVCKTCDSEKINVPTYVETYCPNCDD